MGLAEIAIRLGLSKTRARQIAAARGFPAPAATLIMGQIWRAGDVERWIRKNRPQDARP